jgi:hypothetical protein
MYDVGCAKSFVFLVADWLSVSKVIGGFPCQCHLSGIGCWLLVVGCLLKF